MGTVSDIRSTTTRRQFTEIPRYVRVTSRAREGFVEFNFSISDPTLFLEMILPERAFGEFCMLNHVQFLTPEQEEMVDRSEAVWHEGVAIRW